MREMHVENAGLKVAALVVALLSGIVAQAEPVPAAQGGTVATPTITPNGGNFCRIPVVKLATQTSGAIIRYTVDGSEPNNTTSKRYFGSFPLPQGGTVMTKAFKDGMAESAVATSATFTVEPALVYDPLKGQAAGTVMGKGEYLPGGGWRSQGGLIVYDAGRLITDGYFEATVRDLKVPAEGVDKTHILAGWQTKNAYGHYMEKGSFWNFRVGKGYACFKVLAASASIATRVEGRVGNAAEVNDGKPHVIRVSWKDGQLTFLCDGKELESFKMDKFQIQYFTVGHDLQYAAIPSTPPIFSEIKIVDRGTNAKSSAGGGTDGVAAKRSAAWDAAFARVLGKKEPVPAPDAAEQGAGTVVKRDPK